MAVRVGEIDEPPKFKVPVAPFVNVLDPASVVDTVSVPLFVVVPLIVRLGIATALAPLMVFAVPLNACTPVLAVYVPSFCRFPA